MRWSLVGKLQITTHGVLHEARAGTDSPAVEIDQRAVQGEGLLYLEPEVLFGGELFGTNLRCSTAGRQDPLQPSLAKTHQGGSSGFTDLLEKSSSSWHVLKPSTLLAFSKQARS